MPTATSNLGKLDVEHAVSQRYSAAAQSREAALCCPVEYDQRYLDAIPPEILERDYGCGDPSRYVRPGETVLDLGSGGGKICYITSQIVGPEGRVIGVDMNEEMLGLARKYREEVGQRLGWSNVEFRKGRIQDLALDLEQLDQILAKSPIQSSDGWLAMQRQADELRAKSPMIASNSIDIVLSNCVLNLVNPKDRVDLFAEIHRVLRPGGRAVISDIVSNLPVPDELKSDERLWSGCISGAFVEDELLEKFEQAGFYGIEIAERQATPWETIQGIEFRSVTVRAYKAEAVVRDDATESVIYRGPWKSVVDETGQIFQRGVRTPVSNHHRQRLTAEPYARSIISVTSSQSIPIHENACGDHHGKCC